MKNEFGAVRDRNGYAPSLLQRDTRCYICGYHGQTARHEVFPGPLRQKSKALGMWVHLCPNCHQNGPQAAHRSRQTAEWLKRRAQEAAMSRYRWDVETFIREFGRSYL